MFSRLALCSLALCLISQIISAQKFPQSVIKYMARRQMRYHHFMWHQMRDNWHIFSESTKQEFRDIGWEPPNPLRDSEGFTIDTNYAGEDFLYMHRHMLEKAIHIATKNNESTVALRGWTSIPAPGDTEYPVPPPYKRGQVSNYMEVYKTDEYYLKIKRQEERLKDPDVLRKITLNELGQEIEAGIHNSLHSRWAAFSSLGYRDAGSADNGVPEIDEEWDDIRYGWLIDTYASHVNPYFYKLHGWIDDRVEDWRRANGLDNIIWRGTWIGGPISNLGNVLKKETGYMEEKPVRKQKRILKSICKKRLTKLRK